MYTLRCRSSYKNIVQLKMGNKRDLDLVQENEREESEQKRLKVAIKYSYFQDGICCHPWESEYKSN